MRTSFASSLTPPSSDRMRVVRVGDRRLPDAGWLETVDLAAAIEHLPGARWFASVIAASELAHDLRGVGTWTVLVPTDAAIARWPGDTADRVLLPDEAEALIDVAEHHVARGAVQLDPGEPLPIFTLGGATRMIGEAPWCEDGVPVVAANLRCKNGLIHVIDEVLLPRWLGDHLYRRPLSRGRDAA